MAILELTDLQKAFGGVEALNYINMQIEAGEHCSVIGPNGAGKTTLFNAISGRFPASSGKIIFDGKDITNLPPYKRINLGMGRTFQITNIYPKLTAFENIQAAIIKKINGGFSFFKPVKFNDKIRQETCNILKELELENRAGEIAGNMPYGDQRLLEVGIALANQPRLLLLDEPTAGMSPEETRSTVELIERVSQERKMTLLLIEHDMDVVFAISHRIFVLHQGTLIAEGTPQEVSENKEVISAYFGE